MAPSKYSRDETVAGITDFYRFFITLPYADPSALVLFPRGGWKDINADELRSRGNTNKVVELLRHLLYHERPSTRDGWTIDDGCDIKNLPGNVIPIADVANRNEHYLLLGCITTYSAMANNTQCDWEQYDRLPQQDKWRAFPTAPAREFFDCWIRLYRRIVWMVAPTIDDSHGDRGEYFSRAVNIADEDDLLAMNTDNDSGIDDEDTVLCEPSGGQKEVYAIYMRHGWSLSFDRDACKSELGAYLKEANE